jgi:hypothetical protein
MRRPTRRAALIATASTAVALLAVGAAFALGRSSASKKAAAAQPTATVASSSSTIKTSTTRAPRPTIAVTSSVPPMTVPVHPIDLSPATSPPRALPLPPLPAPVATLPPITVDTALRAQQLSNCIHTADLHRSEALSAAADAYNQKINDLLNRGDYGSGQRQQVDADYARQKQEIQAQYNVDVATCHAQYG